MSDPLTLIGIPTSTMALLLKVSKVTGKSVVDLISEAIEEKAEREG